VCGVPEVEENNWSTPRTESPFVFDGFVWLEVVLLDAVLSVLLFCPLFQERNTSAKRGSPHPLSIVNSRPVSIFDAQKPTAFSLLATP
jgi:hypothetical protein